jgi:RNA recognition motif-containing protein
MTDRASARAAQKFGASLPNPVLYEAARTFSACLPWRHAQPPGCAFRPMSATLAKLREPGSRHVPAAPYRLIFHEYSAVTKLYVGNLPFTATEEAVRALFSKHGTVEKVSLITDRETGRPRGFGFVEMSNADASRAMQALNGTDLDGRSLKVNEAQERERSGGGGRGFGGGRRY